MTLDSLHRAKKIRKAAMLHAVKNTCAKLWKAIARGAREMQMAIRERRVLIALRRLSPGLPRKAMDMGRGMMAFQFCTPYNQYSVS